MPGVLDHTIKVIGKINYYCWGSHHVIGYLRSLVITKTVMKIPVVLFLVVIVGDRQ